MASTENLLIYRVDNRTKGRVLQLGRVVAHVATVPFGQYFPDHADVETVRACDGLE